MENAKENVVLTTQDADFIANICREELGFYNKSYEEKKKEVEENVRKARALHVLMNLEDDKEATELLEKVERASEDVIKDITDKADKKISLLTKAIQLLTSGSESNVA